MIIGLGFRARVGKDTTADYLVKEYGFKKIAFADALKRGCMEIFGLDYEQCYGETKEIIDEFWQVTPRYILQKVGTECLRNIYDPDIWVKSVQKKVTNGDNWVVCDVRFPNEAVAILEWGGAVVRVDRPGVGATGGIEKHASEVAMESFDGWDHVLNNDGTFEDLYRQVDSFIGGIYV
jgi:hypothetical protein